MYEGFEIVTPQRWQSLITHVKEKVEDHYWDTDGLNEELLEPFIIDTSAATIAMTISVMVVKMLTPWKRVIRLKMNTAINLCFLS